MKRGPKPTPTAILKLRGSWRAKAREAAGEPQPAGEFPPAPEWLSPIARAEWERLAPQLLEIGVLKSPDWATLALFCSSFATYAECEEFCRSHGRVVVFRDDHGDVKSTQAAPQVGIGQKAAERMMRAAVELGLTPSSRTRTVARKPAEPENKKKRFFKGA